MTPTIDVLLEEHVEYGNTQRVEGERARANGHLRRKQQRRKRSSQEETVYAALYEFPFEHGKFASVPGYPLLKDSKGVDEPMELGKFDFDPDVDYSDGDSESPPIMYQTVDEKREYIHACEQAYGMGTEEFLEKYKQSGFEGNVDEDRWYRFAQYLKSLDLEPDQE